ncbi:MAG: hypothetical protein V1820_01950 [archaeon]
MPISDFCRRIQVRLPVINISGYDGTARVELVERGLSEEKKVYLPVKASKERAELRQRIPFEAKTIGGTDSYLVPLEHNETNYFATIGGKRYRVGASNVEEAGLAVPVLEDPLLKGVRLSPESVLYQSILPEESAGRDLLLEQVGKRGTN